MNAGATDGSALILRIGDEDIDDVSGVQTYRIEYTVDGLLNPANAQHSGDELYWNVIGAGWEIPLGDLSVAVDGPGRGRGRRLLRRTVRLDDAVHLVVVRRRSSSTFTQDLVPVGDQFSTVTGWPGGHVPRGRADPRRQARPAGARATGLGARRSSPLLVLVGGGVFAAVRVRRVGRDKAYLGLTPGLRPADNQPGGATVGFRDKRGAVSVQFQPPEGVRPGEVGTLVDEKADPVDVTATLVDLAVRGWLRIEEVPRSNPKKKAKDWTLVQLREPRRLAAAVRGRRCSPRSSRRRPAVKLSDLKTTFAASMATVQDRPLRPRHGDGLVPGQPQDGPRQPGTSPGIAHRGPRRHPHVRRVRRRRP